MPRYSLKVNGKSHAVEVAADTPLLWVLRDTLNMPGTKFGCGIGQCGACTILFNGVAMRSCMLSVANAATPGVQITTIEGLSEDGSHPLQEAWMEHDVPQCGYCQSGQIMSAAALLRGNPDPTDEDIDNALAGNLCRCGTYIRIRAAVKTAAATMKGATS